ncbi:MAG: DUF58 domain-containing protein [Actinomycetota bacterium]|nr:DUF58 domain-containing protein [Actinomycetota bacterium]
MQLADATFPLLPRHRLIGLSFGGMRSARRGSGSDVAGSRPYRLGDNVDTIDWNASARLSLARGTDEFIVRERYSDDAPRVVIVCDRRPEMSLFPPPLPWLSKPDAVRVAAELIADSTVAARGYSGYLDFAEGGPFWRAPRSQKEDWRLEPRRPFGAPRDTLTRSFHHLATLRPALPAGSFVFVLSDFLAPPPEREWLSALDARWDVVPVAIQDGVWERSFPDVGGTLVPIAEPGSGRVAYVRLTRREAHARRAHNEERWRALLDGLRRLDLDPVCLTSSDSGEILSAFLAWSERRAYSRSHR